MFELKTTRLRIIPLTHRQIKRLQKSRHLMEKSLGLKPSDMIISTEIQTEINEVVPYWLELTEKNPEDYAWGTNWEIVLMTENKVIGNIGLSGFPDKNGQVMVGYAIDAKHHKNGYATEALDALKKWVFESPKVVSLGAYTPKDNFASQKVLQYNDFKNTGEAMEDGIDCYVWECFGN